MIKLTKIFLHKDATIREALNAINIGAVKIALVVDSSNELLGTICDGDIRRGLLNNKSVDETIQDVYFKSPIIANESDSKKVLLDLCDVHKVGQIPIINNINRVVDLFVLEDILSKQHHENHVILMVGGLGTRLRPLTDNTPKPMLNVGGRPILETIVKGFVGSGFTNITMCLGYKSNLIQDYFQDGSDFGASIDYVVEEKRMGTAGALTLLKKEFNKPFFVMNGDLLTNINFEEMLNFHESNDSKATMCVREYDMDVPYGVVSVNNENIISIDEKPVHSFFVNAGVYLLDSECINLIPRDKFYDMPNLFEEMILNNKKTISFPLTEYWLDIGRLEDFKKANIDYQGVF